jgi:hypothetical protein
MDAGVRHGHSAQVVPGMHVATPQSDLDEPDIEEPTVADVEHDRQGRLRGIRITKGHIFRKTIEVPASRIETVKPTQDGKVEDSTVVLDARPHEIDALAPTGRETLAEKPPPPPSAKGSATGYIRCAGSVVIVSAHTGAPCCATPSCQTSA